MWPVLMIESPNYEQERPRIATTAFQQLSTRNIAAQQQDIPADTICHKWNATICVLVVQVRNSKLSWRKFF